MTPAAFVQKLPREIRVGPMVFKIHRRKSGPGFRYHGLFESSKMRITLESQPADKRVAVDTFIHEVDHALFYVHGLHEKLTEERIVQTLATGWLQIYVDNDWILDWIKAGVK